MIKSKRGTIEIQGSAAEISADISAITYAVVLTLRDKDWSEDKIKKFLDEAHENGMMADKVLEEKSDSLNKLSEILDKLNKALDELDEDWVKEES